MVLNLQELDDTNNLKDGKPGNTLLTYHVMTCDNFTQFKPDTPQYNKLKKRELIFLALKVMHEKNNIITDGSVTTVVLHIR